MFRFLFFGVLQHHLQAGPAPGSGDFQGGLPGDGKLHRQSTAEAMRPDRTRDAALPSTLLDGVGNPSFAEPTFRNLTVAD